LGQRLPRRDPGNSSAVLTEAEHCGETEHCFPLTQGCTVQRSAVNWQSHRLMMKIGTSQPVFRNVYFEKEKEAVIHM
jgi:hypothetical protein